MSAFDVKYKSLKKDKNELIFDIEGNKKHGLDKSIVNSLRRNLLTYIETISFRPENITIVKNSTSLHNEFLKDRVSLLPLYLDPETYDNDYLFVLNVVNRDKPIMEVTSNDFDIYPVNEQTKFLINKQKSMDFVPDDEDIYTKINENPKEYYNTSEPLSKEKKEKILRPFIHKSKKYFILLTELKLNNSDVDVEEIELYCMPSKGIGLEHARFNNVSKSIYTFKINEKLVKEEFNKYCKINSIKNKSSIEKTFNIENSEKYYHRDIFLEPYYYEFTIKSNHLYNPSQLFTLSIDILINSFIKLKDKLEKINKIENYTTATIENIKTNTYKIKIDDEDYNTISILQAYSSRYFIDSESFVTVLGYNKYHPLESIMVLNIMIKENDYEEIQQINYIIEFILEIITKINIDLNILKTKWNL
tara:strand:+ start:396 stop:1649 length:1254 start_codon:yes stop_codon:yes gene_type:complete